MIRAFQWDLARQTERLDWLLAQLPRYADWGYRELYLHLEDAVELPSLPGVARRGAYSRRQFERLVGGAARVGIGVVPIVNLLGHTQYLIKVPELRDLNELRAPDGSPLERGQLCPVHPRTLDVADALMRDVAPFCTAGKVHVGLDESFDLGRHPLSVAEIAEIGLEGHFAGYVARLNGLAASRGLRLGIWADMLALLPGAIPLLPPGIVAHDWYYYPFGRLPRTELRNFAEYDLAPALTARGIEYWGCPMNGSFRHEPLPVFGERLANIRDWWRRCTETRAGGFLVTSWEPSRLAAGMTTVVDAAAASLWLDPGVDDTPGMLARGFERVFGRAGAGARARRALACDEAAFAGYARWEMNDRWDACDARGGVSRYRAELGLLGRLVRPGSVLPPAFSASIRFRRYLAERDVYVRATAASILALRRRLSRSGPGDPAVIQGIRTLLRAAGEFSKSVREGRKAARQMWDLTRDRRATGPNERITAADASRLAALTGWIARCAADPDRLASASPVLGAWQLMFDVVLERPALQRVVVELRRRNGSWRQLHARTAIEFRASAARPRTSIRRGFSVPVPGPDAELRIAVRGLGQVVIARVELSDGVRALAPRGWRAASRRTVGRPAPRGGFPDLEWGRNTGVLGLAFRK
ncbi:MAG TPA: family 20 glycosylhydrolase [Opitutaceae bacterium]|nr:family 20 glycosylhydrolase [Opitutaceae bacterium]